MLIEKERALREINISEKMFNELIKVFIEQTEAALQKLENTVTRKNYEEMRKKAHLISGSAGNLRISAIQKIAKEIEAGAMEKKDIAVIKIHIRKLRTNFEKVKKEVSGG